MKLAFAIALILLLVMVCAVLSDRKQKDGYCNLGVCTDPENMNFQCSLGECKEHFTPSCPKCTMWWYPDMRFTTGFPQSLGLINLTRVPGT